jgi:cbb3-type cytochrome c oxidase subunit III
MISTGRTRSALRTIAAAIVTALSLSPVAAAAEDNERGRALFDHCAQCHGAKGQGRELYLAPAIAGMGEWYVTSQLNLFRSGARGLHARDIGGMRMVPMSRYLFTDEDVKAVSAYVASLPKGSPQPSVEGGDAAKGQAAYALCASCHGADGKGNQQMNAPRLVGTSDWYLLSSLQKYKDGIRGTNPANANAMMMRGMSLSLTDEQAMKDIVAHINSLAD